MDSGNDEVRRKGLAKMNEVYGWEMPDMPGDFFAHQALSIKMN